MANGNGNTTGTLGSLIDSCGSDCIDFTMCDFVNFAIFFAKSKSYGSGCSESLRKDAMLAYSLGVGLMMELELQEQNLGTLNQIGVCAILKKINSLIKKCCAHSDFSSFVTHKQKETKKLTKNPNFTPETTNEKLGLTPASNMKMQENIMLDLAYVAHCSELKEMVPGSGILGLRVVGIAHNSKNQKNHNFS